MKRVELLWTLFRLCWFVAVLLLGVAVALYWIRQPGDRGWSYALAIALLVFLAGVGLYLGVRRYAIPMLMEGELSEDARRAIEALENQDTAALGASVPERLAHQIHERLTSNDKRGHHLALDHQVAAMLFRGVAVKAESDLLRRVLRSVARDRALTESHRHGHSMIDVCSSALHLRDVFAKMKIGSALEPAPGDGPARI